MKIENKDRDGITVLMPTFRQSQFIIRAIRSLKMQEFYNWELIIINDGSPDDTAEVVRQFLNDKRIKYIENEKNNGLGYCLNLGIRLSKFNLIAYLPSDDIFYRNHLQLLYDALNKNNYAVLACSGVVIRSRMELQEMNGVQNEKRDSMQLVQLLHRKVAASWVERAELVSDDYHKLYLNKLMEYGDFVFHDEKTCEWVEHTEQRSKIINEKFGGGMYRYKLFYNVNKPIRFQSSHGYYIDEIERYKNFQTKTNRKDGKALKILIVGELAFNPERICAFEERGHVLYGLWMKKPLFFNTIGPLSFGNVETIPYDNWKNKVKEIKPDVIYALLNWQTVSFAHEILKDNEGIPFVWHFKEDPLFCMKAGLWKELFELYSLCDGRIFTNEHIENWFAQVLPEKYVPSFILDGDLPKKEWFLGERSGLLSERDGEIHTVLPGRAVGFTPQDILSLAGQKIHFHFYGELYQNPVMEHIKAIVEQTGKYFHLHPHCDQSNWIREFSQYDAGWLHLFESQNSGELMRANWNDLNYPARLSTFAAAGLPMLHKNNEGHLVATEMLTTKLDVGIPFNKFEELGDILSNKERMTTLRQNCWNNRKLFQFDHYVDDLIGFFKEVIRCGTERKQSVGSLENRFVAE